MARKRSARIRGVRGGPLVKAVDNKVQLTPDLLKRSASIILKAIKAEIKKDMAKARGVKGGHYPTRYKDRSPVPLPDSERFLRSWRWRISGQRTIEFTSSWPTAEAHTKTPTQRGINDYSSDLPDVPKGGFPMTWLVQPKVKYVPIITHTGQVIIRTAPLTVDKAWIHPGFIKYNFIERGVRKGRVQVIQELHAEILELALQQGVLL